MKVIARCVAVTFLCGVTTPAQTPSNTGFTSLFDGRSLNNWVVDNAQYSKNFSVRDGLLRVEGEGGWLRSARQYGDFTLRLGFRYLTEDPGGGRIGVSGVFLRTPAATTYGSGWPDNSLEVQLANRQGGRPAIPGDARWGGAVLRHGNPGGPTSFDTRLALQSYGRTGEWQTLEIQAVGDAIHVTLNDNYLGTASAGGNSRGYIGFQAETGGIEFRSVEINEGVKGLVAGKSAEGFVPLFDGKTLSGWKPQNPGSPGFDIVDGALVVRGRPPGAAGGGGRAGAPAGAARGAGAGRGAAAPAAAPGGENCNGSIWTEKSYGDFILRYQARFQTNGSVGGFFLRSPAAGMQGGWNQVETRAMEDKLLPWNGILMRAAGGAQGDTVFDYRAANLAYAATDDWTRDWVDYEVRAQGSRVSIWVNGFLLSKAEDVMPLQGVFGLQCERETVEYRNMLIKELPPVSN
jgi:hypothetical protein